MNILGIIGGLMLAAFYIGTAVYIGHRLHRWLRFIFPKIRVIAFAIVFILLSILSLKSLVPLAVPLPVIYYLRLAGGYLTGVFMYMLIFFAITDIAVAIARAVMLIPHNLQRKLGFFAGTTALALTAIVAGYGIYNATQIRIVVHEIELRRDIGDEMTIVLISDLHLGEVQSENRLAQMVTYVNNLSPDMVAIAGDIFNDDFYAIRNPQRAAALFREINAPLGIFACLGNHDSGPTIDSMLNFLEASGIQLLAEEHAIIDDRLVVIGRLDTQFPWIDYGFGGMQRGDFSAIMGAVHEDLVSRSLPPDLPIIVIDHNPLNINEYGEDVDIALFGHTHGGALFPITMITRAMYTIDRGHLQRNYNSPHIVVTQGVHVWSIPLRVGSQNEIVKIIAR